MKKLVLFAIAFAAIVGGVVSLATWTTSGLLESHRGAEICSGPHRTYTATIQNDTVTPEHIDAMRCDRLTIINKDNKQREIAFGIHNKHAAYGGVFQRILKKGESYTFDLVQTGDYRFHDHFEDEVGGTFTVR